MCGISTHEILEVVQWIMIGFMLFSIGRLWEATKK
jgi:hypothetical protein